MSDFETAQDVRMQAAAWLERRNRPEWSAQDQAALDAWLAQSSSNMISYLRVEAAWNRAHRLGVLRQPTHDEGSARKRGASRFLKFASAFAATIAMLGGAGAFYTWLPRTTGYATAIGGHEILPLKDGSQIELNTDTALRVSANTSQREVWLDKGEAYFRVRHDAAHPFIVLVGHRRIVDLGTAFLVRRDSDRVKVTLVEGRVRFENAERADRPVLLKPGDVVTASANTVSVSKEDATGLTAGLGWRHGLLIFRYTTLADAAAEFNRYNSNKLVIADASVGRMKIVGTFATNNVAAFADIAEDVLHLKVSHLADEIVIAR
jgi:transmembrane sensor